MVFDGDCQFCRRWIARWKESTGDAVDYLPFQDEEISRRFPEIPRTDLEEAVHLVLPDGTVFRGAHAVFRSLAVGGRHRWLARLYEKSTTFADSTETLYEEVALHRTFLSHLDSIYSGTGTAPPSYIGVRFLFLRGLALIYLIAFASLACQIQGLSGSRGIAPAQVLMREARAAFAQHNVGLDRFHSLPTFAWWSATDSALNWQCCLGVACSIALLFGIAPAPLLFLLWALYLSLCSICGPFLDFQWDNLLLETGFLAIFFAPLQLFERPSRQPPPPALMLWLMRWLMFRLMFESGCVKLLSGDFSWWNFTALRVHYETQPLPTWIGWYAHQLPPRVQAISQGLMFAIELIVPAFIFCGRRLRLIAAALLALFQIVILLTGNYTFFNWLALLLCLPLLDDKIVKIFRRGNSLDGEPAPVVIRTRAPRWPWPITICLTAAILSVTVIQVLSAMRERKRWPAPEVALYVWLEPFRSLNNYGLFAMMTQLRPEIIVEGSDDGQNWLAYDFKYKPGDLKRIPAFVAPYQPRLDWQIWFAALNDPRYNARFFDFEMRLLQNSDAVLDQPRLDWQRWFAALSNPRYNPWFFKFEMRLLQNSDPVLALLQHNPFPKAPPKYIRAMLYEYRFTDRAERRATGDWWKRKLLGPYVPAHTLEDFRRAQISGS
jgi:predicted DCC family thiol-disulfide oxidoreductase YuxK